jgi:outer membrane protein assembly factor BamB
MPAAALSPDGSRIDVTSIRGVELINATTGRLTATPDGSHDMSPDGDAWSADGRIIAVVDRSALVIVDVSGAQPVQRPLPLTGPEYASAIGWRDQSTVLIHGFTNGDDNTSELYWVDATTGEQESFASYTPNSTGASLLGADAAPGPRPPLAGHGAPRGPWPATAPPGILLAAIAGLCTAGMVGLFGRLAPRLTVE